MIGADPIWLLRPWWLVAVPAVVLAGIWIARRRDAGGGWERVMDPALFAALADVGARAAARLPVQRLLPAVAALVLALALTGPAVRREDAPGLRNLDAALILLDLSPSVARGSGLDDAQAAAADVLQNAGGRPLGLMLFSGEPFLVAAPTTDPATLETPIAVLDPETMPGNGSRPERALAAAHERMQRAGVAGGDVILISDGGGVGEAALAEARRIAGAGGSVSTIAVEVEPGAVPGLPASDAAPLRLLAKAGRGAFGTVSDTGAVLRHLGARRQSFEKDPGLAALLFHDLGRWMIPLAMVPVLLMARRRGG